MTISPATNRARVQELAREGMTRQGGQTYENARTIGDRYLGSISSEAGASLDGIFASAAKTAAARRLYPESAYNAQNFALKALATGVSGPIGPAIASFGHQAIYKTVWHQADMAYSDGRLIGASLLDAIADHGEAGAEKSLAAAARASVSGYLYNESAFKVEAEALSRLKDNVQGADVVRTLADFGRAARMKCLDNENARAVASPILEAIEQAGDPRAAAIANVARLSAASKLRPDAASLAQDAGFNLILGAPKATIEQDLAELGTRALNHCSYADDQRNLGHAILRGIGRHATTDATRLLAQVADDATCPRLYNQSAAGVHYEAFTLLAGGNTSDAGKLLARFGQRVLGRGETIDDTRTMAQVVLKSLASNERDAVRKGVLDSALGLAENAPSAQTAVGIQKFAFNWIVKAPAMPQPQLSGGALSTDPVVLEERIGLNESVQKMMTEEIATADKDLATKKTEMVDLAARFNPLAEQDGKLIKKARIARLGFFAGAAAGAAGVLLGAMLPAGVGQALTICGVMTTFVSWLTTQGVEGGRRRINTEYWPIRNRYDQLQGETQATEAATSASRAMLSGIEDAIRKDKSTLEVLHMSNTLNGTPQKEAGTITMTQDEVMIGGIRISRARPTQAPGEDADAPAVKEDASA